MLVTIVALALGWGIDHTSIQLARLRSEMRLHYEHVAWLCQVEAYLALSDAIRDKNYEIDFPAGEVNLRKAH